MTDTSKLKQYNYPDIIEQLNHITVVPGKNHEDCLSTIFYGLENDHRISWINDALYEQGLASFESICDFYNIKL